MVRAPLKHHLKVRALYKTPFHGARIIKTPFYGTTPLELPPNRLRAARSGSRRHRLGADVRLPLAVVHDGVAVERGPVVGDAREGGGRALQGRVQDLRVTR